MDFIFQRLGRLWRHERTRPATAKRRAVLIVAEELTDAEKLVENEKKFLPYNAYWLYRSTEVLLGKKSLCIPDDIRPTLESVYAERAESGALAQLRQKMLEEREQLEKRAFAASASAGNVASDEQFGTRAGDEEQVQVLLLQNVNCGEKQILYPVYGDPICLCSDSETKEDHLNVTRQLLGRMIKVRESCAPPAEAFSALFLQKYLYIGDEQYHPVRVAYVDSTGQLLDSACNPVKVRSLYSLYYNNILGYEIRKE